MYVSTGSVSSLLSYVCAMYQPEEPTYEKICRNLYKKNGGKRKNFQFGTLHVYSVLPPRGMNKCMANK